MNAFKTTALSAVLSAVLCSGALACTTILVGEKATNDGSKMIARSADSAASKAQIFVIHPAKTNQSGMHSAKEHGCNDFTYPLPTNSLRYTTVPNWKSKIHGAVGYNEAGLGVSGTETIFAKDELLKIDPYDEEKGITEDDIPDIILSRAKSAKEGVELLGKIVEEKGAGEGFGVAFVDEKELWYFETGTAHQWIAQKIPSDKYFATANQGRLQEYDPKSPNFLASKNLIKFVVDNGFYDPKKDGAFNFSKIYTRDDSRDREYNDPRVWWVQKSFNPATEQKADDGRNFPVFLTPEKKITLEDLKNAMRSHYNDTDHDPYLHQNPNEPYRPISVFRTYEAHVMQVRPWLPKAIGEVYYLEFGMADLGLFLPYYAGISKFVEGYESATNEADNTSAYWKYRKLQTLVMTDYNKYAPIVKEAYKKFESKLAIKQKDMEEAYLNLYKSDAKKAQALLDDFSTKMMKDAYALTEKLTNEIFTKLTNDIDTKYKFANKKKKD